MIRITTNKGVIDIELDKEKAPITCENFEKYVTSGFYEGTLFHRVIKGFMIQGGGIVRGGFFKGLKRKDGGFNAIKNEANNGLKNDKYTIAMARTSDPDSATSQFFINVKDNDFLNFKSATAQGYGYAVFGKVVAGFDVVDAIEVVATGSSGMYSDVPKEDVIIERAEILDAS